MAEQMDYVPERDQNWVRVLLRAAFGKGETEALGVSLDPTVLADESAEAGLHVFLASGESAPHGVRLRTTWPKAAALAEQAGESPDPSIPSTFVDLRQGEPAWVVSATLSPIEGKTTPGGAPLIGVGHGQAGEGWYGVVDGPPADKLAGPGRDRIAAIQAHAPQMPWFAKEDAQGEVLSLVAANDDLSVEGAAALFADLADVPWKSLAPAYSARALTPRAYWFEVWPDGRVEIALHGVRAIPSADDLGLDKHEGEQLEVALHEAVAESLPPEEREAGRSLWMDQVWPALLRIWPGGALAESDFLTMLPQPAPDRDSHIRGRVPYVLHRLSLVPPEERVSLLRKIGRSALASALLREAYGLAAARYKVKFKDVPNPPQVPAAWLELSEDEIADRARALQPEVDALHAELVEDPQRAMYVVPGDPEVIEMVPEMLRRAVDGMFVGAPGPLFDYLDQVGRGAFEDDPSAVSLEDVDLEPGERDQALSSIDASMLEDDLASSLEYALSLGDAEE